MENANNNSNSLAARRVRFSVQVTIVSVILSATFFLLFMESFRTYRSTVTIMVTAKSDIAAKQQPEIIANIMQLPRTLAFYDRLLAYNSDVNDVTIGNSSDQRKSIWNSMLDIQQVNGNSSVITLSTTADQESDADLLASKTARTLFDTVSFYYNVKTDVDMRIIDGPISQPVFPVWYLMLLLSVLLGGAVAILLENFLEIMRRSLLCGGGALKNKILFNFKNKESFEEEKNPEDAFAEDENSVSYTSTQDDVLKKPTSEEYSSEREALNRIIEQDIYPNYPEMPVHATPQDSAPDNLPIGEDSFYVEQTPQIQEVTDVKPQQDAEQEAQEKTHEPTPEELRDRLNKLLKGEL